MSENFFDKLVAIADRRRELVQGTRLFYPGDRVETIFVVERGLVELKRLQIDGGQIVLQRASSRSVLAEASVYSANYHCDAVVSTSTSIFEISKSTFLKHLRDDDVLSNLWAAHLAKEIQNARFRSEILSRKTVAARLDGWLAWQGNKLPQKGQWKDIAAQIGISPEALYRELAKRRF